MKKIFILLLTILLILPITVKADLGAPDTVRYKAKAKSPDGCDYYNYSKGQFVVSGHLDASKEIVIEFDEIFDGVLYLDFYDEDRQYHYVKASDVVSIEDSISPTDEQVYQLDTPIEYRVIDDEVPIRKGLTENFKQVGTLKKGDRGTYKSYVGSHIYVETKDASGWVNMMGKAILEKNKSGYITVTDIDTTCGTVPVNTILDEAWDTTVWDGTTFFEYKGCEFEYHTFKSFYVYQLGKSRDTVATEEIPFYDNLESKKVIATISKGDSVKIIAGYSGAVFGGVSYYAEYNNQKGWLDGIDYVYDSNLSLYHEESTSYETTPKEKEPEVKEDSKKQEEEKPESFEDFETTHIDNEKPSIIKSNKTTGQINTRSLIIMCVIAALALAVTSVAFILLLNKMKKTQTVPVTIETKIDGVPCPKCGAMITEKFCEECGTAKPIEKKKEDK